MMHHCFVLWGRDRRDNNKKPSTAGLGISRQQEPKGKESSQLGIQPLHPRAHSSSALEPSLKMTFEGIGGA